MATMQEAVRRLTYEVRDTGLTETAAKLRQVDTAQQGVAESARRQETATQSMERRLNSIQRQYDASYRAQQAMARVERDLAAAQAQGLITAQRRLQLLSLVAERHDLATAAANRHAVAERNAANQNLRGSGSTANIAAQFQDIGVTSAMGMSPIQIALQQGTQLSAVFEQLKANGKSAGGALASAFMSVISPISLVTIGVVALTAVAIQYFSTWLSEGAKSEEQLKREAQLIQTVADKWAIAYPALKKYSDERQKQIDAETQAQATDIAIADKFEPIRVTVADTSAAVADLVVRLGQIPNRRDDVEELRVAFFDLNAAVDENRATSEQAQRVQSALMTLYIDTGIPAVGALAEQFYGLRDAIAAASGQAAAFSFDEQIKKSVLPTLGSLSPLFSGGGGFITEQDVLNDRANRTKSQTQLAAERAARGAKKDKDSDYDREIKQIQERTKALEVEANVIDLSTYAAAKLRAQTELENAARKDAIGLTPERVAAIDRESSAYAAQAAEIERVREAQRRAEAETKFWRDTARGFAADFLGGLREGKSLWESFGDAAINALDRIANRLLDDVFDTLFGGKKNGGGSGILSFIGSLFGGGGGSVDPWAGLRLARGGAFTAGNVVPFASGGAFTNRIVNEPTLFPMANGAGLMGEAGPEGVFPLRRNAQGQLGVIAADNQNGGGSTISVDARTTINAPKADAAEIAEMLRKRDAELPGKIISTITDARRRNVKI